MGSDPGRGHGGGDDWGGGGSGEGGGWGRGRGRGHGGHFEQVFFFVLCINLGFGLTNLTGIAQCNGHNENI